MEALNICMVGYGGIAVFHAAALRQIEGVQLHTVVGRRPEPTAAFAREWDFSVGTTDYGAALADPEVDAVVLTAPSELHYEMTAAALRAGKHVLVEIPLAMSAQGGRELATLALEVDRRVMVAHTRRFQEGGRFVRDFLTSGKAGKVHQHHSYSFWLRHENVGWTGYQRSWVDDVLFHHGCHAVDFSLFCLDEEVRRVRGELAPLDGKTGTSLDFSMLLRYESEAIATISLSYNATPGASGQLFICEGGTLEVGGAQVRFGGEGVFEGAGGGLKEGVLEQNREFVAAVRQGRKPACDAGDAVRSLELLQEVYDQMVELDGEERYRRPWGL
ncbi:MAG: Gfo/Idh/MocA family oxidoreductase [Gemmatimonadetes bacterium]|nr:Gfo/Idh/MocA family oxidoreductase [Gemmatimonadota bacterium]